MGNFRGFRIRHKLVKVFNWSMHRRTNSSGYKRLTGPAKAMSKICDLGRCLKRGAKELCFFKSGPGYVRVGDEEKPVCTVPKGHLAVYVGEKEDDAHRVLVPVIFFNHPLFENLLRAGLIIRVGFKYLVGYPNSRMYKRKLSTAKEVAVAAEAGVKGGGGLRTGESELDVNSLTLSSFFTFNVIME